MRKNYVIDCSVLVFDPRCILSFEGNNVIIPNFEMRRLEKLTEDKKEMVRYQAKEALNFINSVAKEENLLDHKYCGYKLTNDIVLYIYNIGDGTDFSKNYMAMFDTIRAVKEDIKDKDGIKLKTVLVSRVLSLRTAALSDGFEAENYKAGMIFADTSYSGIKDVNYECFDIRLICSGAKTIECPKELEVYPNQFLSIKNESGEKIAYYKVMEDCRTLKKVDMPSLYNRSVYGIKPLNDRQALAMDLLMDPKVEFVSLSGTAGTGKTFLSIAAGLEQTIPKGDTAPIYNKIIFVRPMVAAGEEMGFIPGSVIEKIIPWMGSLYDAIEMLVATDEEIARESKGKERVSASKLAEKFIADQMEKGFLQLSPTTYMRGRTFEKAFVIIDEAQGLTPHIMKMILNRKGQTSKIVAAGDPSDNQIDTELLDTYYNGLIYASKGMKASRYSGLVEFTPKNIVRADFLEDVDSML